MNGHFDFFTRLWDRTVEGFEKRFDPEHLALCAQYLFDTVLVVILAMLAWWLIRRGVARITARLIELRGENHRRRFETVASLVLSIFRYTVYAFTLILIVSTWGYDIKTLVVPASIVAAAIGFGSQGLVQDMITGLSLLAEEQLAVGDFVEVSGKSGVVEEIGLRVVKIRDALGAVHVIFNRNISMVSNYSDGVIQAQVDIFLENRELGDRASALADKVGMDLAQEVPYFPQPPKVQGLTETATGEVFLRVYVSVMPQRETAVQDLYADRIKRAFAVEKIGIPDGRIRIIMINDRFKRLLIRKPVVSVKPASGDVYEGAV